MLLSLVYKKVILNRGVSNNLVRQQRRHAAEQWSDIRTAMTRSASDSAMAGCDLFAAGIATHVPQTVSWDGKMCDAMEGEGPS